MGVSIGEDVCSLDPYFDALKERIEVFDFMSDVQWPFIIHGPATLQQRGILFILGMLIKI